MTTNLEDTSPISPIRREQVKEPAYDGVPAPPPLLLWLVVGLFLLGILGFVSGVVVFREVLRPGQQQRVIGRLPFMEVFLPARPAPDATLPTPLPVEGGGLSPEDLLNSGIEDAEETEPPADATEAPQPTEAAILVQPSATLPPTLTPTLTPTNTPIPATPTPEPESDDDAAVFGVSADVGRPPAARLYGFTYVKQTWNNCGPANTTMALSYYGWREDQDVAASYLKPDREDKNVSPGEIVSFINEYTGVRAITRIGGNLELLKALIANGYPVIIETGYMPEGYDWIGHYQTIVGYDDAQRSFYLYDSFLGQGESGEGISEGYDLLDDNWQDFNRTFIVVYEQESEGRVREILGNYADPALAAEIALGVATDEATANPQDGHAWFNMGSSLVELGRYEEAAVAFDQARRVGVPWRMLWYQFGPFEAYYETGRYADVLSLVEANLNNGAEYVEETFYWQGRVLAQQGLIREATSAFNNALARNPLYEEAQAALDALNA